MLHLAFRAYDDLATSSTGEGLQRFVVAHPKGYDTSKIVAPSRRPFGGGGRGRR
jgi:spoIIIJ-associated protein